MDTQYQVVSEIPKGWTVDERHNAHEAMDNQLGDQGTNDAWLRFHMRPNRATTWNYDEDGEKTTPNESGDQWIIAGDLTNVTRADIVAVIAEALNVNETAVDAKVQITDYTHEEILQYLKTNAAEWGETVA